MHACEECTFSKRCFAAQIAVSLQWEQGYKGKKVVIIQQVTNETGGNPKKHTVASYRDGFSDRLFYIILYSICARLPFKMWAFNLGIYQLITVVYASVLLLYTYIYVESGV